MENSFPNNIPPGGVGRAVVPDLNSGNVVEYQRGYGAYPYYPELDIPAEQSGFDFYKYLRIFTKHRWLIISVLLTSLVLATVITLLMVPIYRAVASIQIDRETINIVKVEGMNPDETGGGGLEFYQTQYELLASRSLAERVVGYLNLSSDAQFNIESESVFSNIKRLLKGQATASETVAGETTQDQTGRATNRLLKTLRVAPVRGSRIVRINIDHSNPQVAQKIANGYADAFIALNLERRYDANAYARKFLEDRLQQLKFKLEESEKQLGKYAEEQGIINLGDNKSLSSTDLESVNAKLSEARADRIKKELLWRQARATDGFGLKEILDNPTIQENRKLRAQFAGEYQQKLATFKPAFPAMVELRNQIKELDRQAQSQVAAIKQSIQAAYEASKDEEEQLKQMLSESKTEVVDIEGRSIQYNILKRESDTNRTLYDGLLQRYKEIGVAGGVGTNNVSIVDKATVPISPQSPKLSMNLILGALAGLLLGCLSALGLDFLDDTFKSPEDVERELSLAVIGVIPKPAKGAAIEDELADPRSGISEAFRSLRTGLQFATSDGLPRNLLITSSKPSEGKTTSSIFLAETIASIGIKVLLIDGDLRNASVHRRLAISNEVGLSNYLSGNKLPEEVVQATNSSNLIVMTSGPLPPNPAELLSGSKFPSLLMLAAESFDMVIVDGPPVMGLADAPLLGGMMQSVMLVVAAHETRRNIVKVALKRLKLARCNTIGVILSKFDVKQTGYGYGYGYGDYQYHSYGVKALPESRRAP
jgi:polysaccharide biosynthesis transport protein